MPLVRINDIWKGAGAGGGTRLLPRNRRARAGTWRDEGAGRNQSGFSLRDFTQKKRDGAVAVPRCGLAMPLSSRVWMYSAVISWPSPWQ
jgi:hypothetical protein